ncbi:Signal transduction histidine kinase [Nakamurella panacisegetis]|uniref:Signal transduction histidine kinase n=1 Tax=Nakamurella panacisegetis TaxID=1090615 RepID=A0A1H0P513_9ACTN|nr:ATP-binding protein [Nakamurella panacisegetis]SDP00051.1 Signal transduction histidine kinase [Nakamurella panacisegetis]
MSSHSAFGGPGGESTQAAPGFSAPDPGDRVDRPPPGGVPGRLPFSFEGDEPELTPDGIPRLTRRRDGSIVGGVAGGVAEHLGVPVLAVRVAFVLMALMAGAGVLAYALLWIFVPPRRVSGVATSSPVGGVERRQAIGIAALGVALMIGATALGLGAVLGWVLGPLGLAALGGAFIWREADDARRARWRRTAVGIVGPTRGTAWRLAGGAALVIGGLSVFALGQLDFTAVRSALIAVLLTLVGVAIITVPWWIRLVRDLGNERQGRIRERERAEIAAHLHDSVLQTLALIQRQAGDSREVVRLARGQERELRTWLYGPAGYIAPDGQSAAPDMTFAAALATAAGEVEDTYALAVAPVVVGDATMDPHLAALVAASREAMVNAAKHSGAPEISVYAEIENGTAAVFIRDRGAGFEVSAVETDRRGLAESIRGRMERHGGKAVVRSTPGEGTEVELQMPIVARTAPPESAPA